MFDIALLAAALWVCPGDLYTTEPQPGCRPFESPGRGSVSTVPEPAPEPAAPAEPPSARQDTPAHGRRSGSSEICALYKEYIALELKTQGGFLNESTEEVERWQTLKRMFQNSPAPSCP